MEPTVHAFIRIELHGATDEQFNKLHKFMEKFGYTRSTSLHKKYPDASYTGLERPGLKPALLSHSLGQLIKHDIGVDSSILVIKYNDEEDISTYHLEDEKKQ